MLDLKITDGTNLPVEVNEVFDPPNSGKPKVKSVAFMVFLIVRISRYKDSFAKNNNQC